MKILIENRHFHLHCILIADGQKDHWITVTYKQLIFIRDIIEGRCTFLCPKPTLVVKRCR